MNGSSKIWPAKKHMRDEGGGDNRPAEGVETIGCAERARTRTPGHGLILEEIDGQYR